jgi:AraC family transcriptional regulator
MESEPVPLEPGRFYGVNRRERHVGELILSDTHYRPAQHVPPHLHQRTYFAYLIGGGYSEQLGQRSVTPQPLSLAFRQPREVQHGEISDRGARLFHVELPDTWIDRVREHGTIPDVVLDHHRGPMLALARTIYREFREPDAASPIMIEGVVLEMLGALLRSRTASGAGGKAANRTSAGTSWIARARDILHARALSAPTLAEVAADVGVAPVRLARAFRRTYGESPGDYVRRERIRIACERLATGEVALAALAAELGFYDQSHFTRVFCSQVGITPGAWQRDNVPPRRRGRGR